MAASAPSALDPKTAAGDSAGSYDALIQKAADESHHALLTGAAFGPPGGALDFKGLTLEHEASVLERTLLEEQRELGKQSFWYFVTKCVYPNSWQQHYSPEFHKDLCWDVQNLQQGHDLWVFVPREHRKSFILTILHSIWMIVRDPNVRILLIGAREETVKPFARLILSAFLKGTPGFESFQKIYWDYVIDGRGRNLQQAFQFTHPLRTETLPDPTFRAAYLGVAGAGWRCDIIHFDDSVERRNVTTPEMSAKTGGQMFDLFPLVDTGSKYRNVIGAGTRWAYHDPYGMIIGEVVEGTGSDSFAEMQEKVKDQMTTVDVIVRHALEDPNRLCEVCPKHVTDRHPHGHPTMGDEGMPISAPIHTRQTLMERFEKYLKNPQLGESLYWHQYMNVCMAPSAQKFKDFWIDNACVVEVDFVAPKRRILAIDSASKDFAKKGTGDWMVALMGGFDEMGRLLIRHGLRDNRWTKDEFIRQIISYCKGTGWWPHFVVKEKFGEDSFMTDVYNAFLAEMRPVHCLTSVRPPDVLKKNDFIVDCLQGPMERLEVLWGSRVNPLLIARAKYELTKLGQVAHDDVADCLSLFFVPGVRVERTLQAPRLGQQGWAPPALGLYEPASPFPVSPAALPEVAPPPRPTAVQAAVHELGMSEVRWDPPAMPVTIPNIRLPDYE